MSEAEPRVVVDRGAAATFTKKAHRPALEFRDLGAAAATGGAIMAQVVRAVSASEAEQVPHHHEGVDTQFFYLLAGTMTVDYAGEVRTLQAGDFVMQPAGLVHAILSHSADLALLEVSAPAAYTTVEADDR